MKFSEFALQLREKQKCRRYYGVLEKQFRKYYQTAAGMKGDTGLNLLRQLELRFDNVVYSLGLACSRREAKQLIRHNHFMLNGRRANIPSMVLRPGDVIEVKESSRTTAKFMSAVESGQRREVPLWLSSDKAQFKGEVKELPAREHVTVPIEENMIVEFYSR
jgi:small subunit ribosomal protein S4